MTSAPCHTPRTCPGCGDSLDHRDPQVLTCSARCRQRVHRARVAEDYDPDADYRARAATWDPDAELARIRSLDLQPAAAVVPLVDPAERLRAFRRQALLFPRS